MLSSQCVDAWSVIETTYVHRQSSCLLLHFQALLHVLSFNVTSAWLLKIKCSHVQSEFITDVSDLLLMLWLSLLSERSDCHYIFCISFHDTLDLLLLRLQDVSFLRLILSAHHDEWWLKSIFSISAVAIIWVNSSLQCECVEIVLFHWHFLVCNYNYLQWLWSESRCVKMISIHLHLFKCFFHSLSLQL